MLRILLVCSHASAIQGWGNMETTEKMKHALEKNGHEVIIFFAETNEQLIEHLTNNHYDLVWSSVYYFTKEEAYINNLENMKCVSDVLEEMKVPYVGSSSQVLKDMIDKFKTLEKMRLHGLETHKQLMIPVNGDIEELDFENIQYFVKPSFESESNGVDEGSIVHNMEELKKRVHFVWEQFSQPALVEEFLSGEEYTVAMIGNDDDLQIMPIKNVIDPSAYERYAIITQFLKVDKKLSFEIPEDEMEELSQLAIKTKEVVGFWDHVRIDMRRDKDGILRVIEVNGIPGLNPIKSRIFEIYNIYNPENEKEENYCSLLEDVVQAALARNKRMENGEIEVGKEFAL